MTRMLVAFIFGALISAAMAQIVSSPSSISKIPTVAVGSLPTCNGAAEGTIYGVTDALVPAALSAVAGGGAVHTLVYCNGTSWIVG